MSTRTGIQVNSLYLIIFACDLHLYFPPGAAAGKLAVIRAKEKVDNYKRHTLSTDIAHPPPYNPYYNQAMPAPKCNSMYPEL